MIQGCESASQMTVRYSSWFSIGMVLILILDITTSIYLGLVVWIRQVFGAPGGFAFWKPAAIFFKLAWLLMRFSIISFRFILSRLLFSKNPFGVYKEGCQADSFFRLDIGYSIVLAESLASSSQSDCQESAGCSPHSADSPFLGLTPGIVLCYIRF